MFSLRNHLPRKEISFIYKFYKKLKAKVNSKFIEILFRCVGYKAVIELGIVRQEVGVPW